MIRWKPLFSVVGMASGVLLGLSILVLLHQNGTLYPTRKSVIIAAVAGLLFGIVMPSLMRLRAVSKANKRLAANADSR